MVVKVGIIGLGFMGKCHYDNYKSLKGAKVVAICDVDPKKRKGDWSSIAGNIGGAGGKEDLSGITTTAKAGDLFADEDIDVVDICLPTFLHKEYTLAALKAGKHVICEKPMARTSQEAKQMVAAAKKARRQLFIGQCIRYWPAYSAAREVVKGKKYGKVISATFRRQSPTPTWSWKNWLMNTEKSGDCALDLHIHDADFVVHCLGKPRSVSSVGSGLKKGRLDHITTTYEYPGNILVTAEGGWEYPPEFPFSMRFEIVMEKATVAMNDALELWLYPQKGKAKKLKIPGGDGYSNELADFIGCISTGKKSKTLKPEEAMQSVRLIEFEERSARNNGRRVKVNF